MHIPSRLSTDDAAIDWHLAGQLRVYLDGVEQKYVTAYDIEAGTVTVCATDANGAFLAKGGDFVIECLTGHVEVTLKDQAET